MAHIEKISKYSRGWTGSAWVKRQTSKIIRRETRRLIKEGNEEIAPSSIKHVTHGWTD